MKTCEMVFSKCINDLENCKSFEDYYNLLKRRNTNDIFYEYYVGNKKEIYTYKDFFQKIELLTIFLEKN